MKDLIPMVTEREGVPITTSRAIAEQFGKTHAHILRDIQNTVTLLEETESGKAFNQSNFGLVEYTDEKGEARPMYLLTRDGFTLLAMGFTGAKAMQFKVAYINAFNRMEQILRGGGLSSASLQRIEERLDHLEAVAGIGREEAGERVGDIFLKALKDAITDGDYFIRDKHGRTATAAEKQGKKYLLGVIDGSMVCVKCWQAYKLYCNAVAAPMSNRILWQVLEEFKVIENREKYGKQKTIDRKRIGVIFIDANKLLR